MSGLTSTVKQAGNRFMKFGGYRLIRPAPEDDTRHSTRVQRPGGVIHTLW